MSVALLLDEMHPPAVADALRGRGHDVVAVAASDELRAMADEELFRWAGDHGRRIVTENVKDFGPLSRRADEAGLPVTPVLFTSSRAFPRSRRHLGLLINSLDAWVRAPDAAQRPAEDWLVDRG